MEANQKLWQRIGLAFILCAALILAYGLYNLRLQRIANTGTEFFTGFFLSLSIATLVLHLLLFFVMRQILKPSSQKAKSWTAFKLNPQMAIVWIVISLIVWFLLNLLLSGFKIYAGVYFIWLLLLDIGLLLIAYREKLPAWQNAARGLAVMAFGIFVSLMMLELLMRFYFGVFGSMRDKIAYIYSVDEILAASNRYQGYPYINYGLSPDHPEHNRYGYRGEAFERPKPEGVFRIFTLGGSTTFGASLSPQEAYPAQLQRVLREDYGYSNVEVVNAGVSAYASADSLANLAYRVLDDEPDMIIIYDNINDVRARLVEHEDYSGLNLQRGIWSPNELAAKLNPFVLVRFIQIQLGIVENPNNIETLIATSNDVVRCQFRLNEMCEELGIPAQEVLDSNPPIYYERNLRNMVAIAGANDVEVVFATWAYYDGETPLENILTQEYVRNAADEHNDILRRLGSELNVPVIDFNVTVPIDGAYWQDGMHMTAEGTAEQARQFAAFLVENGLIPQP